MSRSEGNVTVIDHPLIQHKLTIMRNKETSIAGFRRLLREIAHLMCYEVTRDLALEMITIETPMAEMQSPARIIVVMTARKRMLPSRFDD